MNLTLLCAGAVRCATSTSRNAARFATRSRLPQAALVAAALVLTTACSTVGATHDRHERIWHERIAGRVASVEVFDRTSGVQLPVYEHAGRRWVAGTPGHRYAVVVRNVTAERVLAVLAVDGVNAVTGATAAWDQNGYVFAPWQRWEIRGWRKSQERIAAFEFTALPDSYAARTGRPAHVGVIGVALFRERPPRVALPQAPLHAPRGEAAGASPEARSRADAASEPSASQTEANGARELGESRASRAAEKLGTGHGRSETSIVGTTEFERASAQPDQVVTIYYDSYANLVALGVIAPRTPVPAHPQPFPGSVGFVPDPPR